MPHLFSQIERPLPDVLAEDLRELLTWDNNCYLTWSRIDTDGDPAGGRWFTVRFSSDGRLYQFRLEFWIPRWMDERGVAAIVPASRSVAACEEGRWAAVELDWQARSQASASVPRVARTCARLINELWGPTQTAELLLTAMEYQNRLQERPFSVSE